MEKRVILAVALSILIIVTFQYLAPTKPIAPPTGKPSAEAVSATIPSKEAAEYPAKKLQLEEKPLDVETDKYILTFSDVGGAIKAIRLKDYKDLGSTNPLELAYIADPEEYIFSIESISSSTPLATSAYNVERTDGVIIYSLDTGKLKITKKYILHNSKHAIELQLFIKNTSPESMNLDYSIISGAGLVEARMQDNRFLEASANINGKAMTLKRPRQGRIVNLGIVSWAAVKNKYFSIILKPFVVTKDQFHNQSKHGYLVLGVEPGVVTLQPGSIAENRFFLYAGPSQISELKEFGYGLEETVNYGFFGGISKVLIAAMFILHNVVHSWGVSIVLLSLFLNIILFPLTVKSFKSMQKMQELHPQMEKLKTQYKDNPQKLNKEVMELYKKYNINPFSGCLPMLLQMPIFIALYQALMKSIELRGSSFLWIKDLSSPDAVRLPFTLPIIGSSINILPIVMVVAMVVQQKISTKSMGAAVTEEQKQQQKMMLMLMPVMFGFIFYNMPSGLVLYWAINTILTILEQAFILKKETE